MGIKENMLNMPAWKAAALGIIGILSITLIIESFINHKVFSVLNGNVSHFKKVFKDDENEVNTDLRESDERFDYNNAMSDYMTAQHDLSIHATPQEVGCFHIGMINRYKKMLELPYVKHNQYAHDSLVKDISGEQAIVQASIENHEFDPAQCEKIK
jgi:hypothetical protein